MIEVGKISFSLEVKFKCINNEHKNNKIYCKNGAYKNK